MHSESLISLRDVRVRFGNTPVLDGIDLQVRRGQAVSIIGPSGSGKSTILRCINGLLRPQSGAVEVCGTVVSDLAREADFIALRKKVGFVFQQYNLFPHLTGLQNLMIAPCKILKLKREEAEPLAWDLLRRVRMEHKAHAFAGELSGGQQQRVAIARALAMQPEVILFDEVTSALDPETVGEVLNVIEQLTDDGMTCVLVTHEMRFAEQISDVVYFTEGGRITAHGSAEQIFQHSENERIRDFLKHAVEHRHSARHNGPDLLRSFSGMRVSV